MSLSKLKDKSKKCLDKVKNSNWQGHLGDVLNGTAMIIDTGKLETLIFRSVKACM